MSLKVTDSDLPIVQPSTCLKNLLLNLKVHSENKFRTYWHQLFMKTSLFNDIVDCFFDLNILK